MNVMKLGLFKQPCEADCANRTITCKFDGSCDKYKEFDAKVKKLRKKRIKDKEKNGLLAAHVVRARKNFTKHKAGEL